MSTRTALHLRCLIAVAVLTVASIVLIAGSAHDQRRSAGVVRVQPAVSIATVRP
ncbi:hypothetical protein [Bradyrhizobium japonicum]|uniref:hypothetical protein n=1 Tax=Bradyrhizobium japonicum TaxID=375 RepID=UPI001BA9C4A1|nr:hypothetical protein [Bradyrhizobium japonicum]MBR0962226.1 hypothetical protein [Bradyrhizobium japonicum]